MDRHKEGMRERQRDRERGELGGRIRETKSEIEQNEKNRDEKENASHQN